MGKSTQPLLKRCKALGINPVVMGYTKESKRNQKEVRRAKKSEYGLQLTEKQKLRFIWCSRKAVPQVLCNGYKKDWRNW